LKFRDRPVHSPSKQLLRRLARLGASNFETVADTRQRQADMLRRLEEFGIDPGYYVGLHDCGANHCGLLKCAEACWFGTRARRIREIPAIHQLFAKSKGPIHVVQIVRGAWERPFNQLGRVSIAAAKQLNRRAFDDLYSSDIVAVGIFKILIALEGSGPRWVPEIHEIVAGPTKSELYTAFKNTRPGNLDFIRVDRVENLAEAISSVLKRDLEGRAGTSPKRSHRAEFYRWLLRVPVGTRIVRYGCDRYFNKLLKQPRPRPVKIPKKRPRPRWLEPSMYGSHSKGCTCRICSNAGGRRR
jgi:hypothetical protein